MSDPRPTLGAAVHYMTIQGEARAAIVTAVSTEGVGAVIQACALFVMHPDSVQMLRDVPYDESGTLAGGWHWPSAACQAPLPFTPLFCDACGDEVGPSTKKRYQIEPVVPAPGQRPPTIRCEACVMTRGWE